MFFLYFLSLFFTTVTWPRSMVTQQLKTRHGTHHVIVTQHNCSARHAVLKEFLLFFIKKSFIRLQEKKHFVFLLLCADHLASGVKSHIIIFWTQYCTNGLQNLSYPCLCTFRLFFCKSALVGLLHID